MAEGIVVRAVGGLGDYLKEQMRDSTLRVMKATGHCPHMSDPEETVALMKEYLQPSAVA